MDDAALPDHGVLVYPCPGIDHRVVANGHLIADIHLRINLDPLADLHIPAGIGKCPEIEFFARFRRLMKK